MCNVLLLPRLFQSRIQCSASNSRLYLLPAGPARNWRDCQALPCLAQESPSRLHNMTSNLKLVPGVQDPISACPAPLQLGPNTLRPISLLETTPSRRLCCIVMVLPVHEPFALNTDQITVSIDDEISTLKKKGDLENNKKRG